MLQTSTHGTNHGWRVLVERTAMGGDDQLLPDANQTRGGRMIVGLSAASSIC